MNTLRIMLILILSTTIYAQQLSAKAENEDESAFSFRFSGFVKTDYWLDSRTVVAAREDLFLLYPAREMPDSDGKDIHGDPVFNFSAITSRLALHLDGPDAFGASVSGFIEADFSGVTESDINGFRLRHAYLQLQWERLGLMLGQWWHPLFGVEVIPSVVSLNTGAPFQPFIRNPQATLTYQQGKSKWLLSMIAQRDNASDGPAGASPDYIRTATVPNMHLQWSRTAGGKTLGLAADYKLIRPRTHFVLDDGNNGNGSSNDGEIASKMTYTDERLGTYAFMAYGRMRFEKLDIRAKTIFGQNLSEHLMMGGYAETFSEASGYTYTPLNHLAAWANILYGERVVAGLFMGYGKNFGAAENLIPDEHAGGWSVRYYGRSRTNDISYLYRVAPSITFNSGSVALCTEFEYTAAAYGTPDERGRVRNHDITGNFRLLFTAFYFF